MVPTFSVYFWRSEGRRVRNEALMIAVLKRGANTRSHWIIACDANVDPTEFVGSDWVDDSRAKVGAPPRGSATYCAKGTGGVEIRKLLDYFVVSEALEENIVNVDVVNEYLVSPHKAVRWTVKLHTCSQWIKQLKVPKKLPGASG